MKEMKIQGAIFDMDGTLVDSLMLWDILWEEMGRRYCGGKLFVPDETTAFLIRTTTLPVSMETVHTRCGIGASGEELLEVATETFANFYSTRVELKPGIRELLAFLKDRGVKMCIASAGPFPMIKLAMEHCGIKEYFPRIISCSEVGKGKEAPDVYFLAQEYLGTSLEKTWVFEDSIVALRTAVAAGLPTVGVYDQYGFGHEEMKQISTEYIGKGESFEKLIPKIQVV